MPGWLRGKLTERPAIEPVQTLCTYVRQPMTIRDVSKRRLSEDGFNEVSETVSDNLINAFSKLTATQEAMKKQINKMETQMIDRNCQEASTSTQPSTNQHQQEYRGNRGFQPQRPPNPNQSNRGNQPFRGRFGNPYPVYQGNQQFWNHPPFANQYQQQCNQQPFPN